MLAIPAPYASGQLIQKVREAFESLDQNAVQPEDLEIDQAETGVAQNGPPNAPTPSSQQNSGESVNGDQLQWGRGSTLGEAPQSAESLPTPPPTIQGRLPLAGGPPADSIHLSQSANGNIDLRVRNQPLSLVLSELAKQQGLNIVASNDIDALISITLRDVPLEEALTAILSVANYTWVQRNGIILITSLADSATLPAEVQGRQIQVFELDFASAAEIQTAVTNLLTPGVGKVSISATDPADNRRTRELVVVEDLPDALARIAAYIHQVDQLPRQVLIEAHVLQVTLTDETRCGVDFHALCRLAGSDINFFGVPGISTATTSPSPGLGLPGPIDPPAFVATFTSHDLNAVIQALETTTDSKTLGSPKLLVLNGQQAHIQVGETIYYQQTTTTETTTQAGAASVETGVILRLTPRITEDGRVLLRVEPQVSSPTGERPSPELPPNIARIELQSDVMLRDGEGMIIGGLIDERDVTTQQKLPYLGEVKGLGWLFRHSITTKERSEIIFALVPRIQPYSPEYQAYEQGELVRAGVPLMEGPLCRTNRPWDVVLPDGKRVYRPLIPKNPHQVIRRGRRDTPYVVPPQPWPVQRFPEPQWDAEWQRATAHGSRRPLLSDEVMALPPNVEIAPQGEIISDQN